MNHQRDTRQQGAQQPAYPLQGDVTNPGMGQMAPGPMDVSGQMIYPGSYAHPHAHHHPHAGLEQYVHQSAYSFQPAANVQPGAMIHPSGGYHYAMPMGHHHQQQFIGGQSPLVHGSPNSTSDQQTPTNHGMHAMHGGGHHVNHPHQNSEGRVSNHSGPNANGGYVVFPHPKRGTVTCRHWMRGRCDLGNACNFKHSINPPPANSATGGSDGETAKINLPTRTTIPEATLTSNNCIVLNNTLNPRAAPFTPTIKSESSAEQANKTEQGEDTEQIKNANEQSTPESSTTENMPQLDFDDINKEHKGESSSGDTVKNVSDKDVVRQGSDPMDWLASENTPREVKAAVIHASTNNQQ